MRDRPLTRHFLRRFVDNDLISANADRHEVLSLAGAVLVSVGVFVTLALSFRYMVVQMFQSPGRTAIWALDDRSFFIAWSMILMALVAVVSWDGLVLDPRDTEILGPLPVSYRAVVRAKLEAIALAASGFAVALNLGPTVFYPSFVVGGLPVGLIRVVALTLAQGIVCVAAGAFGFLAVLGLREVCRALLGTAAFRRLSALLQGSLLVVLAACLLLLPGWYSNVATQWLTSTRLPASAIPPLWFVGLHETVAGSLIAGLPRGDLPGRLPELEAEALALYRSLEPLFRELGELALTGSGIVLLVTVAAYAWNSRRPPVPAPWRRATRSWAGMASAWIARQVIVRKPGEQAGFFFTLQSLWRSTPHRLSLATSLAVALGSTVVMLYGVSLRPGQAVWSVPLRIFAVQVVLVLAVLLGFRHAIRLPADFRANWMIQLSWSGDDRGYAAGVKRAAFVVLGLPLLLAMLPLYVPLLGWELGLLHLVGGACIVLLLLELVMLEFEKLPFACRYAPEDNLKALAGIYLVILFFAVSILAGLDRLAFSSTSNAYVYLTVLLVLLAGLSALNRARPPRHFEFDELPASATQCLTLGE
jgi:hypothetical protein